MEHTAPNLEKSPAESFLSVKKGLFKYFLVNSNANIILSLVM